MKTFKEMAGIQPSPVEDLGSKVWNLFSSKDLLPTESDFKALGQAIGINHEILEEIAFGLLHDFVAFGTSKCDVQPSHPIDYDELDIGIQIEFEHTCNYRIAEKIARDHLTEIPDYYTRLTRMERIAKAELKFAQDCDYDVPTVPEETDDMTYPIGASS